jgi:hypothetical protein
MNRQGKSMFIVKLKEVRIEIDGSFFLMSGAKAERSSPQGFGFFIPDASPFEM